MLDRRLVGILFACASYGVYSFHYATMKWLGGDYSLWQLIFVRSVFMIAMTVAFGGRKVVTDAVRSPYKASTAFRGVLQMLCMICFYMAANVMSLAEVMTIYSTAPLMIVVLSVVFLGERIGTLSWLAIAVGFVGTVIAANPSGAVDLVPALLSVGSGLFWALTVVFTRKSGARDSSSVQLIITGLVMIVMSLPFMNWTAPTPYGWALMALLGVQIYLAQYFFFEACRSAPASLVGPLEYTSLVWASMLGYLIFADVPTLYVIVGAALVAASGVTLALVGGKPREASAEPA